MYAKPMMLNEKLGEQLPLHFEESVQVTELYGIEVELEGKGGIANPTDKIMENWVKHNDGSLRKLNPGDEAVEYVSRVPRNKIKTTKALMDLIEFLTGPNKVVYDSYRTSIHVHVNCMADKMIHVYSFITLCIIFDELLASQNGEHRIGNNFCLATIVDPSSFCHSLAFSLSTVQATTDTPASDRAWKALSLLVALPTKTGSLRMRLATGRFRYF